MERRLAVIVPTKNRWARLRRLLASIEAQTLRPAEVIVVDDGSSEPAAGLPAYVTLLRHQLSRGQCAARNTALRAATSTIVAHFDDDVELNDPSVFERAVDHFLKRNTGAVALHQLRPDGTSHHMQPGIAQSTSEVSHFIGCGFLVLRSAWMHAGGFEEAIGYYYDEIEFCIRLRTAGYRVIYDPAIRIVHHEDARGRDWQRIHRIGTRNAIACAFKNYPAAAAPIASIRYLMHYFRLQPGDFRGAATILAELPKLFRNLSPSRRMTWRELIAFRRLMQRPMPLETTAAPLA